MKIQKNITTTKPFQQINKETNIKNSDNRMKSSPPEQLINISDASSTSGFMDMSKVQALKDKIENNNYNIDLDSISEAIKTLHE
jgi:anti-sigma28 factor (negative regulator of flagellin synthesis)